MKVQWKAVRYMIIAMTGFAAMNFIVKYLNHLSAYQLVFFRAIGTLLITLPLMYAKGINIWGNQKLLLISRGLFGTTSLLLFFLAVKLMPIGTCVTLRHLSPIFAAIFALLILGEKVKIPQWVFFLVSFSGVFLIKGFDPNLSIVGLILIIISGALSGLVLVVIRKIKDRDHPFVIINYFMLFSVLVGLIGSISTWVPLKLWDWPMLLLLGVFGFIAQYYMTKAAQLESTDIVAPMKYIEIPLTVLLGILFFGEIYGWASFIGFFLIIGGLLANLYYKSRIMKAA